METITRIGMPLDEFIREYDKEPFELIDGERIKRVPSVAGHTEVIRALFVALYLYVTAKLIGEVFSEATFILPDAYDSDWVKGSRMPDVMFYSAARMAQYKAETPDWKARPYTLVPDFVAEVISPNDTYSDVDEKVDLYLADGVRLIWLLDPQRVKAVIHAPDLEQPIHLSGDAILDGGDVLPDFQIGLKALFER